MVYCSHHLACNSVLENVSFNFDKLICLRMKDPIRSTRHCSRVLQMLIWSSSVVGFLRLIHFWTPLIKQRAMGVPEPLLLVFIVLLEQQATIPIHFSCIRRAGWLERRGALLSHLSLPPNHSSLDNARRWTCVLPLPRLSYKRSLFGLLFNGLWCSKYKQCWTNSKQQEAGKGRRGIMYPFQMDTIEKQCKELHIRRVVTFLYTNNK